jgi:hypothetical protein
MNGQVLGELVRRNLDMRQRSRIAGARVAARRPTQAWRSLPDFLVIGTMRGGSSSLFRYLCAHPGVRRPLRKEVEYFTRHHDRGVGWYRQHFPLRRPGSLGRGGPSTFEATPYYLFHPLAPVRASALLPGCRLVALLRDPVDRAWSHHQHMTDLGFEQLGFAAALAAEESRLAPELVRMAEDPAYFSRPHHRFSYLARGRYAEQLERWLACYPRSQILVLDSRDLYARPAETFAEVTGFLGLADWQPDEFRNHSRPHVGSSRGPDPALRSELYQRLEADDRRLADLWGRTPGWRS